MRDQFSGLTKRLFICLALCSVFGICHASGWPVFGLNSSRSGAKPDAPNVADRTDIHRWPLPDTGTSPPIVHRNMLFTGTDDNKMHALSVDDGRIVWSIETGGSMLSAPCATDSHIFLAGMDRNIRCADIETGALLWNATIDEPVREHLLVTGNALLVPGMQGSIFCFDVNSGKLLWSKKTGGLAAIAPAFCDDTGLIIAANRDGTITALNLDNGSEVWQHRIEDSLEAGPVVFRHISAIGCKGGFFHILDSSSGSLLHKTDAESPITVAAATAGSHFLVLTSTGRLHGIDTSGRKRYTFGGAGTPLAPPILVGNNVFFITDRNRIYSLCSNTNTLNWTQSFDSKPWPGLAAFSDNIVTGAGNTAIIWGPSPAEKILNFADRAIAAGDLHEALNIISEGLQSSPGNTRLLAVREELSSSIVTDSWRRFNNAEREGDVEKMKEALDMLESTGTRDASAYLRMSRAFENTGDLEPALDYLGRAFPNPADARYLNRASIIKKKLGKFAEAADLLKNLQVFRPDDLEITRRYARALIAVDETEEAERIIRRILTRDPDFVEGQMFLESLNRQQAADIYERALGELRSESPRRAMLLLRNALELCPDYMEAQALLKRLSRDHEKSEQEARDIAEQHERIRHYLELARKFEALGSRGYQEAMEHYDAVLDIDPDYREALEGIERLSELPVDEIEEPSPKTGKPSLSLPRLPLLLGSLLLGVAAFGVRIYRLRSQDADLLLDKARHAINSGKNSTAIENLEAAMNLAPDRADIIRTYADLCLSMGRKKEALQLLGKLSRLKPGDTGLLLEIAGLSLELNVYDKAKEAGLKLLNLQPGNLEAQELMIEVYRETGRYDEIVRISEERINKRSNLEKAFKDLHNAYAMMDKPMMQVVSLRRMHSELPEQHEYLLGEAESVLSRFPALSEAALLIADIHHRNGFMAKAQDYYNRALQQRPDDIEIVVVLAEICSRQEKFGTAIEHYRRALRISPDHISSMAALANIFIKTGRMEDAADQYERMLDCDSGTADDIILASQRMLGIEPEFTPAKKLLGKAYMIRKRYDHAIPVLKEIIDSNRADTEVAVMLSKAFEEQSGPSQAISIMELYVSQNPGDPEGYRLLTDILARHRKSIEMTDVMKQMLEKHPEAIDEIIAKCTDYLAQHEDLHINSFLANLYKSKKDLEGAVEQYLAILNSNPDNLAVLEKLGCAYIRSGNYTQSVPVWKKALELSPEDMEIRKILASVFLEMENYESALDELAAIKERDPSSLKKLGNSVRRIIRLDRTNRRARLMLAEIFTESGRTDRAIREYERLLEFNAQDKAVYRALYRLLCSQNEYDRAIEQLRYLFKLENNKVEHLYEIADCYKTAHKFREAASEYKNILGLFPDEWPHVTDMIERLLKFDPNCVEALEVKADCLIMQGNHNEAIGVLNNAVRLEPARLSTMLNLARLRLSIGHFDSALTCAARASEIAPQDLEPRIILAEACLASGDIDRALKEFTALADKGATELEERRAFVADLVLKRNIIEYEGILEDTPAGSIELDIDDKIVKVKHSPDFAALSSDMVPQIKILYLLGKSFFDAAMYDKAISALQKVARSDNEYTPEALYYEAISFFRQGYSDSGKRTFEKLEECLDNYPETQKKEYLYKIAEVFEESDMFQEGVSVLQRLLAIDFEYRDVKLKIDRLSNRQLVHEADKVRLDRIISNKYSDIAEIGVGGMGKVYRAVRIDTSEIVAIKVISEKYRDNPKALARFIQRDGRAAMRLQHPNIIRIFDVVEDMETPHIVMEYLDGESFRQILDKVRLIPYQLVLEIGGHICSALDYAHNAGVVHRDIKPDNIMLNTDENVKIMDFGLARMLDVTVMTETGETFGTLSYMAPEQINAQGTDARTDIFALGVTFYELLTGVLPFCGDNPGHTMYKILNETPVRPREINPEIPVALDEIVMKCLEKDLDSRFSTAGELKKALEGVS